MPFLRRRCPSHRRRLSLSSRFPLDPPAYRHNRASNSAVASNCGTAITHATAGRESSIIRTGLAASYRTRDCVSPRSLLRAFLARLSRRFPFSSANKQRPHRTTRNEADSIKQLRVCQARLVPVKGAVRTVQPLYAIQILSLATSFGLQCARDGRRRGVARDGKSSNRTRR